MLSAVDNTINIINSNCLTSICSSLFLSCIVYLLATPIHEIGHWVVTLYCCRPLKYHFKIKLFSKYKGFKPHTESDYYTYLDDNKYNNDIQKIIRKISIAGYIASFVWLFIILVTSFLLFFVSKLKFYLYFSLFNILFICFDIRNYKRSSDRLSFKEPSNFNYNYK